MNCVVASAPASIFITGEPAIVFGYPGVLAAVQKRTFAKSDRLEERIISITSDIYDKKEVTFEESLQDKPPACEPLYPFAKLCATLSKNLSVNYGLSVDIWSEIPAEAGMSSSSASLCAVAYSIVELLHIQVMDWYGTLYPLQKWIHGGKASGSELTSSQYGELHLFRKVEEDNSKTRPYVEKITSTASTPLTVVIGDTGVRVPTALPIGKHVPLLRKRKPSFVETAFDRIGKLAEDAVAMICVGDLAGLGAVLTEHQEILRSLKLSHPKLDDAIEEAVCAGALGAKQSGGGWGGVMFALVTPDVAEPVARAIEKTGCETVTTELGGPGMRIERSGKHHLSTHTRVVRRT